MTLQLHMESGICEVGLDEAGRGPGLGPVYTAAVFWGEHEDEETKKLVRDSKQIKPTHMKTSFEHVIKHAIAYTWDWAGLDEINEHGIYNANMRSLHRCLDKLIQQGYDVKHILMDGNSFHKYRDIKHTTVVKGDSKFYSIAAASILAKYQRDQHIKRLCEEYPDLKIYGIHTNMGYLSTKHREMLVKHGYTQFHRKKWKNFKGLKFNPVPFQIEKPKPKTKIRVTVKKRSIKSKTKIKVEVKRK